MRLGRDKPPPGCDLLGWLSETINDAMRDCGERGLGDREMAAVVLSLGSSRAGLLRLHEKARLAGCSALAGDAWTKLWDIAVTGPKGKATIEITNNSGEVVLVWPDGSRAGLRWDHAQWIPTMMRVTEKGRRWGL